MKSYCTNQGRSVEDTVINNAMIWSEPGRDVKVAREQASRLMVGPGVRCVWTGRLLSDSNLDIDHCLPWASWPCGDLWNLLPAHRSVNQQQKRDLLPSAEILKSARERIEEWWEKAYYKAPSLILPEQFRVEAKASLPIVSGDKFELGDVFAGLTMQRLRLKNDQQVPEWHK